jgi:hypothetical protein
MAMMDATTEIMRVQAVLQELRIPYPWVLGYGVTTWGQNIYHLILSSMDEWNMLRSIIISYKIEWPRNMLMFSSLVRNQVVNTLVWLWWVNDLSRFEFEFGKFQ